jgi:hypothetical protein
LCTGFSEDTDGKNWTKDFDAVLKKPVLLRDMARTIRNVFDGKRED